MAIISLININMIEKIYNHDIKFELLGEKIIEEFDVVNKNALRIKKRTYKKILISNGCKFAEKGKYLLNALLENGIEIFL